MDYMKIAIQEAKIGIQNQDGGPFGAVVVKDGKIIGQGHNCVLKNNDPTCHGEIMAIRDACKNLNTYDLSGAELYTTCYPCPMCLCAMMWANIQCCYFGCDSKDADRIGFRDDAFYQKVASSTFVDGFNKLADPVAVEDCKKLFEDYLHIQHTIY